MPRKNPNPTDANNRNHLDVSLESVHLHAARLRKDLSQLKDHAAQLANYVSNLAENSALLLSESVVLRTHAESFLKPSPEAFLSESKNSEGKFEERLSRLRKKLNDPDGDGDTEN